MRPASCPPDGDLEQLFLGILPEDEALAREDHILTCDRCLERLKTLARGHDPLVELLRQDESGAGCGCGPVLDDLIKQLKSLGPTSTPPDGLENTPEALPATVPIEKSRLTDFLAPPQGADELGRLGKYRILAILGHGGMGVVFRAEDCVLRRTVALKAMLPALAASASAGQRFLREAQTLAAVEHERIVRIFDVAEERGVPFLAMEFLKGESLDARLEREKCLHPEEVVRIGKEIAEGLEAAHAGGMIHRDVKPANIWLEAPGSRVKLLDFGLARSTAPGTGLTQQGTILGTPAYMAPEQARSDAVDARCDLFSLGCVLYRMATGQVPFQGRDTISTLMAVATEQPPPPRTLNAAVAVDLEALILRLLAKDPGGRPASAREVVEALTALEGAATAVSPVARTRLSRRTLLACAAVLLLALPIAAVIFSPRTEPGVQAVRNDPEPEKVVRKEDKKADRQDQSLHKAESTPGTKKTGRTPLDAAWLRHVATLTPKKQVEAVIDRLKERNPGFDGTWRILKVEKGKVTGLLIASATMNDLTPVQALPELKVLECPWSRSLADLTPLEDLKLTRLVITGAIVTDLSPLKRMPLTFLDCSRTHVTSLEALRGLPLEWLGCEHTGVYDLSPLEGMPLMGLFCQGTRIANLKALKDLKLAELDCSYTSVFDLDPLQGMPLTSLWCVSTPVSDLTPLRGMKLTSLDLTGTQVSDLSPLEKMPLNRLRCQDTRVSSLEPLRGTPLTYLYMKHTSVSDLSPLQDTTLKGLWCDFMPERDAAILRSIKTLQTINERRAEQVLNEAGTGKSSKP